MDDLSGKISSFLDDPNNMDKIKSIADLLGGDEGSKQASGSDSLAEINPDMLLKFKRIMDRTNTKDDKRVNLLLALRPYLNDKRKGSMDSAMKIIKISKLASIIGEGLIDI